MKCVIPGINIKVFGRAVHSLAKIGDELYVEPGPSGWANVHQPLNFELVFPKTSPVCRRGSGVSAEAKKRISFRTVNAARSAFVCFHFGSGFFSYYDEGISVQKECSISEEAVKCKVAMKAFLNSFKSLATLERNVERCKLIIDGEEARLGVQLTCRYGIVKTYNLSFIECETLQAVYNKSGCTNYIQSQSKVWSDVVVNFQPNQEEVTLCVAEEKTIIRNYVDDEPDPLKAIHTVLTMEAGEFDGYDISAECEVTFCLKELRAVLTFAEPVNLPVSSHFSAPGSPIIFVCDNSPVFEATFVLATLSKKADSQIARSQAVNRQASQTTQYQAISGISSCLSPTTVKHGSPVLHSRGSEHTSPRNNEYIEKEHNFEVGHSLVHGESSLSGNKPPLIVVNENKSYLGPESLSLNALHEDSKTLPSTPSPPAKKAKFFSRCFDSTFDPKCIPGIDRILAEDSDDDS
ncbi:cell cycle checkpoint control protein RAD9A-like isoform X3 [Macrobrachium nipponense]|uniref:cell cycle checkpoint control protein RAD9A-like isoform X3 n=1 Tax=Macrobrachium nipponense TaxID=159736 RepID=UPI0030C7C2C1